ncbi:hypothetical protein JL49_24370 [Pseudoalteromonas luteoviolacea]|nr:hypothetical protein JL49_24370 [Pseudoalteromonas luteoviolacea]
MRASYDSLVNDNSSERLRNVLKKEYPEFTGGCVLHWTPDQGEDIFVVLVNGSKIISVELVREDFSEPPIIEHISLSQYKLGLKKSNQIKLAIAQEVIGE